MRKWLRMKLTFTDPCSNWTYDPAIFGRFPCKKTVTFTFLFVPHWITGGNCVNCFWRRGRMFNAQLRTVCFDGHLRFHGLYLSCLSKKALTRLDFIRKLSPCSSFNKNFLWTFMVKISWWLSLQTKIKCVDRKGSKVGKGLRYSFWLKLIFRGYCYCHPLSIWDILGPIAGEYRTLEKRSYESYSMTPG